MVCTRPNWNNVVCLVNVTGDAEEPLQWNVLLNRQRDGKRPLSKEQQGIIVVFHITTEIPRGSPVLKLWLLEITRETNAVKKLFVDRKYSIHCLLWTLENIKNISIKIYLYVLCTWKRLTLSISQSCCKQMWCQKIVQDWPRIVKINFQVRHTSLKGAYFNLHLSASLTFSSFFLPFRGYSNVSLWFVF